MVDDSSSDIPRNHDDPHGAERPGGWAPGPHAGGFCEGRTDLAGRLAYLAVLMRRAEMAGRRGRSFAGGIRAGQGRVLGILALQSPLGQKNLAYMLGVRPQSLSELLTKLERNGLVERRRDENDRRTFLVAITDEGRTAAEEISHPSEHDPFEALDGDEQKSFSSLLERIIAAAEAQLPDGSDPREAFRGGPFGGRGRGFGPGFGPGHGPGFMPGFGRGFGPGRGADRGTDPEAGPWGGPEARAWFEAWRDAGSHRGGRGWWPGPAFG